MWTSSLSICIVKKGQYSTYVYCSYTCIHTCIHSTGTYIHSTDTYIDACMSAYIDQYIHASLHLSIHSSTVGPKQWRWLSVPADSSRILFVSRWTQIACLEVSRFCLVKISEKSTIDHIWSLRVLQTSSKNSPEATSFKTTRFSRCQPFRGTFCVRSATGLHTLQVGWLSFLDLEFVWRLP